MRAYTVNRMPEDERLDKKEIENLRGTPQQPDPNRKGIRVPVVIRPGEAEGEPDPISEPTEPAVRRRVISRTEMDKYGYMPSCPGCDAKARGEIARMGPFGIV